MQHGWARQWQAAAASHSNRIELVLMVLTVFHIEFRNEIRSYMYVCMFFCGRSNRILRFFFCVDELVIERISYSEDEMMMMMLAVFIHSFIKVLVYVSECNERTLVVVQETQITQKKNNNINLYKMLMDCKRFFFFGIFSVVFCFVLLLLLDFC